MLYQDLMAKGLTDQFKSLRDNKGNDLFGILERPLKILIETFFVDGF